MNFYSITAGVLLAWCTPACAGDADWVPVSAATLDSQRGGFVTAAGLQIALGVERVVSINGEQVSRTSVHSAQVGALARVIQRGENNVFGATLDVPGATVIQNSLNGQTIRTDTYISANVNSAALMRELNFQHSLREVALSSSGPR